MPDEKILGTILLAAFVLLGNLFRKGGWLERWRSRSSAPTKPPPIPSSGRGGNPASPDAQMRRLLEALGRPVTDSLPPPVPPAPKGRPSVLTASPPQRGDIFPTQSRQKSKKQRKRERAREQREAPATSSYKSPPPLLPPPATIAVERFAGEIEPSVPPTARGLGSAGGRTTAGIDPVLLRRRFSRLGSAREAVLLAEILGPPLALRLPAADAQFN